MKIPVFDLPQIKEIVAKYPTPFHLYDEKGIIQNCKEFYDAFKWNSGFCEYFAVKALPNPFILNILKGLGCGVDCASLTELMLAKACGFSGDKIMLSSNATPSDEFEYAREIGATINLDDITHIDFLEKHGGIPETVCCRYNPGGDFSIGNAVMGNPGDAKYGFTRAQLTEGFKILIQKGVKNFGLHAFLASNTTDQSYYPILARMLFEVAVELKNETGANISFINLSGGIGIPYHENDTKADIYAIAKGVEKAYEDVIAKAGMKIAIKSELGRYMTGPFGYLISTAIHEKKIHKHYIGLDSCAANLMRPAMYGSYHHISVMGKEAALCDHKYDITGSLCENNDKFAVDRMLPEIKLGDIIVIHDTGAHGFSMGYNYNGKLRSAEVLLKSDGTTELIRRAETPADYFATFDFCDIFKGVL